MGCFGLYRRSSIGMFAGMCRQIYVHGGLQVIKPDLGKHQNGSSRSPMHEYSQDYEINKPTCGSPLETGTSGVRLLGSGWLTVADQ